MTATADSHLRGTPLTYSCTISANAMSGDLARQHECAEAAFDKTAYLTPYAAGSFGEEVDDSDQA